MKVSIKQVDVTYTRVIRLSFGERTSVDKLEYLLSQIDNFIVPTIRKEVTDAILASNPMINTLLLSETVDRHTLTFHLMVCDAFDDIQEKKLAELISNTIADTLINYQSGIPSNLLSYLSGGVATYTKREDHPKINRCVGCIHQNTCTFPPWGRRCAFACVYSNEE